MHYLHTPPFMSNKLPMTNTAQMTCYQKLLDFSLSKCTVISTLFGVSCKCCITVAFVSLKFSNAIKVLRSSQLIKKNAVFCAVHVLQQQTVAVVLHAGQVYIISYSILFCKGICPCSYVFSTEGGTEEPFIVSLPTTADAGGVASVCKQGRQCTSSSLRPVKLTGMKRLDDCNLNFNTVDNIFQISFLVVSILQMFFLYILKILALSAVLNYMTISNCVICN